ncbi:hypothetical protein [Flavobacterium sp. I3-2]|uniref:hypothetical protein n=1 Tax=Flavobacterium sp. I3-2 TaxID=2748319 RepID=UPI0015B2E955|nr:hypothetical protein [Flavobacterium sp. I3-2]
MSKFISYFLISLLLISCNKKKDYNKLTDYRSNSKISAFCKFPDTVKVGETNVANYIFLNSTFDTIIEPRVKESVKYRYILFSEYFPENLNNFNERIYADSILLDKNSLNLSYEFDEEGTFFIGGLILDELYYDYRYLKSDSLIKYVAYKVVSKKVIVVK